MKVNEICKALSHDTRRIMLKELSKISNGITFKEFCLIFNANPNTIAFHTKQLIKAELVSKPGRYHITELGRKSLNDIKNLENRITESLMEHGL